MVQGQQIAKGGGVFQQGLDSCHTAKKKKISEESHIKVFDWPESSPALNPSENLCSVVKTRLLKKDCTTKTK